MASLNRTGLRLSVILFVIYLCVEGNAKFSDDNKTNENHSAEVKIPKKMSDGAALVFADEFKQTMEKYIFGICPQSYKMPLGNKNKNATTLTCDLDADQEELAGRLATLALRAHSAARSECARLGAALANTLGDLARTASNRQVMSAAAANEANKKRKLSKSQKAKIQAKQRTALAVKKKAAAVAAAAAAKIPS